METKTGEVDFMEKKESKVWGIHTRDEYLFLNDNIIAIGWEEIGDLSLIEQSRDSFKEKYALIYPDSKKGSIPTCAGMLYRFLYEIEIGDFIVFPSKISRQINIGVVEGEYYYSGKNDQYPNRRKVKWIKHCPRTYFSQGALYEIGAAQTLFMVKNYADEFLSALNKKKSFSQRQEPDISVATTADSIIQSTKDFILKELSRQFKGYDLEPFIANLLEAMGYRTTVSQHGGDRGIDIIAYKDELPPRILVQVKSNDGDISESVLLALKGAMQSGDYGLFVTLSNYTKNAKQFLESTPSIRGINGNELVDLILKYYESLDESYRNRIPLKMVYIPIIKDMEE